MHWEMVILQRKGDKKAMKRTTCVLALLTVAVMAGCSNSSDPVTTGGPPSITRFTPAEVSKGEQNVEGHITGNNLSGASAVDLGPGIKVESFQSTGPTDITVTFSVAGNASTGARTISVTTGQGTVSASLLTVLNNSAPRAKLEVDAYGSLSIPFGFDATSSSDADANIASYSWDFGDGSTDKGKKATHLYKATGQFTVTLTVEDRQGATDITTASIEVLKNGLPLVKFSHSPPDGSTITEFTFTSHSEDPEGKITDEVWSFGDGDRRHGSRVTHTFQKAGTYSVELTVTDNKEQKSSLVKDVEVEKSEGVRCSPRNVEKGVYYVMDVISANRANKELLVKFRSNPGCRAFFKCGDIRKGGFPGVSPGDEHWIGTMCEFIDLGNGQALITVEKGNYWPSDGETKFYTWPQECGPAVKCKYNR